MASKRQLRHRDKLARRANSGPVDKYSDDELDYLVDEWHLDTNYDGSLAQYLGWSDDEYARWVETCKQPGE